MTARKITNKGDYLPDSKLAGSESNLEHAIRCECARQFDHLWLTCPRSIRDAVVTARAEIVVLQDRVTEYAMQAATLEAKCPDKR